MASRLNARLDRIERSSGAPSSDATANNVLGLLGRLEDAGDQALAEVLHNLECPRAWQGLSPLRDPEAVPDADAVAWFTRATGPARPRVGALAPLCPLCTPQAA